MQSPVLVLLFCLVAVALATPHDPIGKNETRSDAQENPLMERYSGCSGDENNPGVCLHCCGEGQTEHSSGRRNCRRRNICCVDVCDGSTCGGAGSNTGTCVVGDGVCPAGTFSEPDSAGTCAATCSCCGCLKLPKTTLGCLKIVDDTLLTWKGARDACVAMGGGVVAPDSEADFDALAAYLIQENSGKSYWTSASNIPFIWEYDLNKRFLGDAQNAPLATDWGTSQPTEIGTGIIRCGFMFSDFQYRLHDTDCAEDRYFICEIKNTVQVHY